MLSEAKYCTRCISSYNESVMKTRGTRDTYFISELVDFVTELCDVGCRALCHQLFELDVGKSD